MTTPTPTKTTTRRSLGFDTTGFVTDRFAKIATTYTGGYTRVQYAASVCTNVRGLITLPVEMRRIADGTYEGADFDEKEALAMSYINHEMGHDDVELRLRDARARGEKIRCSKALYRMLPPELRRIGMKPGARIVLTSEWLANLDRYGKAISLAYDGAANAAARQLAVLCNAAEDPRQEALVGARWAGAREHLRFGHEHSLKRWTDELTKLKMTGKDHTFLIFAIGMVYELHDGEHPFGSVVQAQIDACRDLIDLFRAEGDWTTPFGYFDSVNFALACLSRVYRRERAAEAPVPHCSECGSERLRATMSSEGIFVVCLDCGHREEIMPADGEGDEAPPPAMKAPPTDRFASHYDPDAEKPKVEKPEIEVGSHVRVKATGQRAKVTKLYPDGSFDVEVIEENAA